MKQLLVSEDQKESVHLCSYPKVTDFPDDSVVIRRMKRLQLVVGMVRNCRSKTVKFGSARVPIKRILVIHDDTEFLEDLKIFEKYMYEEINTIKIEYSQNANVKYKIEPNNKQLGLKYRKLATFVKDQLALVSQEDIKAHLVNNIGITIKMEDNSTVTLDDTCFNIVKNEALSLKANELGLAEQNCMVIFDASYDDQVIELYLMRLFIVSVQKMRKNTNLRPWNKIGIYYETDSDVFEKAICKQIKNINEELGYEVKFGISLEPVIIASTLVLEGHTVHVTITDQYTQ